MKTYPRYPHALPFQQQQAQAPARVSGDQLPANRQQQDNSPAPRDNANEPPANKDRWGREELEAVFRGDFFDRLDDNKDENGDPIKTPAKPTIQAPDKPRNEQTPAPAPKPNRNEQTTANLLGRLGRLIEQQENAPPTKPKAEGDKPALPFNILVPMEIVTALRSESDADVQQVVSLIYNSAANSAVAHVEGLLRNVILPGLRQKWMQDMSEISTAREALSTFYAEFPELRDPIVAPTVKNISDKLAAAYKEATGEDADRSDPDFMRQVGLAARAYIKRMAGVDSEADPGNKDDKGDNGTTPVVDSKQNNGGGQRVHPRNQAPFMVDKSARPPAREPRDGDDDMDDVAGIAGIKRW